MNFKSYSRLNTYVGWLVFAISAFTYLSTIEPTVNLWDCGEFTSSDYKLQVCHPPGAPFYMLIYKIFTMFSFGHLTWIPILANSASALLAAATVLFLFWTITAFAVKLMVNDENTIEKGVIWAILGAGIVGALAYNFSDTAWFSAVEAEVYSFSSFLTAIVIWLGMKWERRSEEKGNLRWMILIFYFIGWAIGVHLLGLLGIPAIILIYYFKKYKVTPIKTVIAIIVGFAILGTTQIVVIQWLLSIAGWFDRMFVNDFSLPIWSGVLFFFVALLGILCYGVVYSIRKRYLLLNTGILCFIAILMGYFSYAMVPIRAYANTPINMYYNQDVYSLIGYLSREQYGDTYLVTGPYYTADFPQNYQIGSRNVEAGSPMYRVEGGKYVEVGQKPKVTYADAYSTVFPRMFHSEGDKVNGYRYWTNIGSYQDQKTGKTVWEDEDPSFRFSFVKHNLKFFWDYQMNYMYWRYFAWNFIGRQNDLQGVQHEFNQGNFLTGIPSLDRSFAGAGPQDNLPVYLKENKARNLLFGLPLILGLIGIYFQFFRKRQDFLVVLLFFFMTGIAIELYLNMPSPQPRERDYAFVGSFYVFTIWIGLGVLSLYELFKKWMNSPTSSLVASTICLLAVPVWMCGQEWDDHDRSGRYTTRDYATNYLESCDKNGVLFTNGDNDTYPLWYCQEVEGIRDDIRIINLSLFGTDWYVNEMRKPINHTNGLKFTLTTEQTKNWEVLDYNEEAGRTLGLDPNNFYNLRDVFKLIGGNNPSIMTQGPFNRPQPTMPVRKFYIPVDRAKVIANKTVSPEDAPYIVDSIKFTLYKNSFYKSDVMLLDFIATNNWDRPVYFSYTSGPDEYLSLTPYLQQEGLTYRLVPINHEGVTQKYQIPIQPTVMYNHVMQKFKWGNADKVEVLNDFHSANQAANLRRVLGDLSYTLASIGQKDKALKIAELAQAKIREVNLPLSASNTMRLAQSYYKMQEYEKGKKLASRFADVMIGELDYYSACNENEQNSVGYDINSNMGSLQELMRMAQEAKQEDLVKKIDSSLKRFQPVFQRFAQQ